MFYLYIFYLNLLKKNYHLKIYAVHILNKYSHNVLFGWPHKSLRFLATVWKEGTKDTIWNEQDVRRKHSLQIKLRVSQTFRCYEPPHCLDRTEQVCALKENSLRKFQRRFKNSIFELKTNRLCTPFRECWEKLSSRQTKHNTMWLAFFEGTGQQTHAIVPESRSRFRGRAYRVHSRAVGRPASSQAGGDVGEAVLTAHGVPVCSGTVTDCVAGR